MNVTEELKLTDIVTKYFVIKEIVGSSSTCEIPGTSCQAARLHLIEGLVWNIFGRVRFLLSTSFSRLHDTRRLRWAYSNPGAK